MRVGQLINEEAFEPKKHQARKLEAQAISTRPPKTRRSPRSQPRAQAIGARLGSRTLLYPANHRLDASRTVQAAAPEHRRRIEFCCPPDPLHLVCAKFGNAFHHASPRHSQKRVLSRLPPNLTSARAATAVYGGTGAAVGAPSGGALGAIGNHPATTTAILIWRKLCRMRTKCAKVLARAEIVPEINEHHAATRIGASGWSFGCTVNG